jgi:ketosteroid isomerase-like protein
MTENMETRNEAEVRRVIEEWARAVSSGDRAGILARHAKDVLMFDFAEIEHGIKAYDRTWDFFFSNPKGPIVFTPADMMVTAGDDVAFASCTIHCDGTSGGSLDLRLTVGLRKVQGQWTIMHEHHSVPTTEERFIEPGVSRAKGMPAH